MPTYEYNCRGCGNQWEAQQSMKDDALTDCPKCGEPKARRLISGGTGFVLKGGGWYSDLYGSSKASAGASGGSTASDGSSSEDGSSSRSSSEDGSSSSADASSSASNSSDD